MRAPNDDDVAQHGGLTWVNTKSCSLGLQRVSLILNILLWSIDTCQNKVSADECHMTISWAQVKGSLRTCVFVRFTADQALIFDWIAGSCLINL